MDEFFDHTGFQTRQLIDYTLEPNPDTEDGNGGRAQPPPPQKLAVAFSTADVVILGWQASEIFDALISVLHDSKEELAFNGMPRKGKWGTPTARAFPTALGNAFVGAIATRYLKQQTN